MESHGSAELLAGGKPQPASQRSVGSKGGCHGHRAPAGLAGQLSRDL